MARNSVVPLGWIDGRLRIPIAVPTRSPASLKSWTSTPALPAILSELFCSTPWISMPLPPGLSARFQEATLTGPTGFVGWSFLSALSASSFLSSSAAGAGGFLV